MVRITTICGIASCLMLGAAHGQRSEVPELTQRQPDSRTVLGVANEYLAAGAEAIRVKEYDEGIRLTKLGLERPASPRDRSAALSNLCAAHAAKNEPDLAIGYCTESLGINDANWRAYSNRAYAYYLKRMFDQADADLDLALSINPNARQMPQIRGMMNERRLRGRVTTEDHH
jgi:tetratricopeptide (TPR) repeat protein